MIRRFKLGRDVELHKRTLEMRRCCRSSAPTHAACRRRGPRRAEHANAPRRIGGRAGACSWPPTPGSTCCRRPSDADAVRAALAGRRRRGASRRPRSCASSTAGRATASTSTTTSSPRRPASTSARVVHQGLLRRPGDGRAAVLPRQAEPPPARPAAVGAGHDGDVLRLGEKEVGRLGARRRLTGARADRARAGAARGAARATRSRSATGTPPPRWWHCRLRDSAQRPTVARRMRPHGLVAILPRPGEPIAGSAQPAGRAQAYRAERSPIRITLVMPAHGPGLAGRETMRRRSNALASMRDAGLEADGVIGDAIPWRR